MTIVYTSETGFTEEYAKTLAKAMEVPVYSLEDAYQGLEEGREIFYLGWMMAGRVKEFEKASKKFKVAGLCGVGIRPDVDTMVGTLAKVYHMKEEQVFYLPGGYHPERLKGSKKVALTMVLSLLRSKIRSQSVITPEERKLLLVFSKGGSLAQTAYLEPVEQWLRGQSAS